MKNIYPSNPVVEQLIIKEDKTNILKIILFTPLTKQQCDEFIITLDKYLVFPKLSNKRIELNNLLYKYHNFTFDDIIGLGDTKLDTRSVNSYIESVPVKLNDTVKKSFKCFVNKDWREPKFNVVYHEDGGCSWNCLMQKLRNPEYGIVFSIPYTDKSKFKIND